MVVGGHAVNVHGYIRATEDTDVLWVRNRDTEEHLLRALDELEPPRFCRKLYDIPFDGRRKDWGEFQRGLSLWSHTPQKPMASDWVIELDPILLFNVHGSGYCGIQSGLLEAVYQSRPRGTPGKPAIDARRWFLNGIVHSVTDAFYDGRWHYYDVDQPGWAGDTEKGVWRWPT